MTDGEYMQARVSVVSALRSVEDRNDDWLIADRVLTRLIEKGWVPPKQAALGQEALEWIRSVPTGVNLYPRGEDG